MSQLNFETYHEFVPNWKELLRQGLEEDGWQWDWTSRSVQNQCKTIRAKCIAKAEGIWSASGMVEAAKQISQEYGFELEVSIQIKDGDAVQSGQELVQLQGSSRWILSLERPFLNLASYVCGISTRTNSLVKKLEASPIRLTPTRKTLPGYRNLAVYGVVAGGGVPHRLNLASGVLLKENHIQVMGGVEPAIKSARETSPHGLKIEVEVRSLEELNRALEARADVVMLDNFTPQQVKEALGVLKDFPAVTVEVSGGIDESTIQHYVQPGVHVISVGGLTHSVQALDLSLLFE